MISDENIPVKTCYSIGEVAKYIGESTSLVRFWEKKFSTIRPKKNAQGVRVYMQEDLKSIVRLHHLVKKKGYTLEGAKLELVKHKTRNEEDIIIKNLQEIKIFLQQITKI